MTSRPASMAGHKHSPCEDFRSDALAQSDSSGQRMTGRLSPQNSPSLRQRSDAAISRTTSYSAGGNLAD
jgi:hypothetical protein